MLLIKVDVKLFSVYFSDGQFCLSTDSIFVA